MLAPVATRTTVKTPSGRTCTITVQRTVALANLTNPFSLTKMTDTITDNGAVSTLVFDGATRLFTVTTAAGRSSAWRLDAQGRMVQAQHAGRAPVSIAYDSHGLPTMMVAGSGTSARTTNFEFNGAHELTGIRNALSQPITLTYDLVGRPVTQTLADGQAIGYAYDANGNMSGLTPPGRPTHNFGYTALDRIAQYTPPDVNVGADSTVFSFDIDRQLTAIARPDGQTTNVAYDGAGRLAAVTIGPRLSSNMLTRQRPANWQPSTHRVGSDLPMDMMAR